MVVVSLKGVVRVKWTIIPDNLNGPICLIGIYLAMCLIAWVIGCKVGIKEDDKPRSKGLKQGKG